MSSAGKLILKYALLMALFCGAAGLLLPAVYELTAPRRLAYQRELEAQSLRLVFPEARRITPQDGYYETFDGQGKLLGYVLKISVPGYSSNIEMLAGLRRLDAGELQITGVKILAQAETPGLGAKIENDVFTDGLFGRTRHTLRLKKDGGDIDTITGATITSRAVVDGLRRSLETFAKTGTII